MPAPYGQDLRDRTLAAYDRGKKTGEIADMLGVSPAWARRVKQTRRQQRRTTRLAMGGVRVTKIDLTKLRELVERQPDATIAELHQRLGKDVCCESAVGHALKRLGLSFKKRRCMRPSKTGPTWPNDAPTGRRRKRKSRRKA